MQMLQQLCLGAWSAFKHNNSRQSNIFYFRIDDIEDNSSLRRGVPVAHNIFGVASTINSANYVYFLGLEKCLELDNPRATAVFTGKIVRMSPVVVLGTCLPLVRSLEE